MGEGTRHPLGTAACPGGWSAWLSFSSALVKTPGPKKTTWAMLRKHLQTSGRAFPQETKKSDSANVCIDLIQVEFHGNMIIIKIGLGMITGINV
jgi:hypothetical protein